MTPDGGTSLSRWTLALLAAAQTAAIGWVATGRAGLLWAFVQALLLALAGLALVADRYARLRRAYVRSLADAAARDERLRLAEDLHDVLGHELSLVALRAGGLQLAATGQAAEQAAAVRAQVCEAVLRLAQVVELLRTGSPSGGLAPATPAVDELVDRARRSGTDVLLEAGAVPHGPAARDAASRVVQEGLTNAAKHAPGNSVEVRLETVDGRLEITVGNDCRAAEGQPAPEAVPHGTGLAALARQVAANGGRCWTERADGRHLLRASLPPDRPAPRPVARALSAGGPLPSVAALRWALPPAAVAVALVVAFYSWASHGATLEQDAFDAVRVGQAADGLELPHRQAPVRLIPAHPAPHGGQCAYYTDGNFPLAMAAFEICVADGRVSRVTDLRTVPPW